MRSVFEFSFCVNHIYVRQNSVCDVLSKPPIVSNLSRSIDTFNNRPSYERAYERRNIAPQVRASCYNRTAENSTSDG